MAISRTAIWLQAFRLHTLPLAVAGIGLGSFLASDKGHFEPLIATLTIITALSLQILSNLANDYGDSKHGADNEIRTGPGRVTQSGAVTHQQIKNAILLFILICLVAGILLLYLSISHIGIAGAIALFLIGLVAIAAAIAYTATKKPYGYRGYGDLSVFIFFGLISVCGSFFLQTGFLSPDIFIPAAAMGMLCSGVLNINNIRDIEADMKANKLTVALRLGLKRAKQYHWLLMLGASGLFSFYLALNNESYLQYIFLLPLLLFIINAVKVSGSQSPAQLNPLLKQLVIFTLLFVLVYGTGLIFFNENN